MTSTATAPLSPPSFSSSSSPSLSSSSPPLSSSLSLSPSSSALLSSARASSVPTRLPSQAVRRVTAPLPPSPLSGTVTVPPRTNATPDVNDTRAAVLPSPVRARPSTRRRTAAQQPLLQVTLKAQAPKSAAAGRSSLTLTPFSPSEREMMDALIKHHSAFTDLKAALDRALARPESECRPAVALPQTANPAELNKEIPSGAVVVADNEPLPGKTFLLQVDDASYPMVVHDWVVRQGMVRVSVVNFTAMPCRRRSIDNVLLECPLDDDLGVLTFARNRVLRMQWVLTGNHSAAMVYLNWSSSGI